MNRIAIEDVTCNEIKLMTDNGCIFEGQEGSSEYSPVIFTVPLKSHDKNKSDFR